MPREGVEVRPQRAAKLAAIQHMKDSSIPLNAKMRNLDNKVWSNFRVKNEVVEVVPKAKKPMPKTPKTVKKPKAPKQPIVTPVTSRNLRGKENKPEKVVDSRPEKVGKFKLITTKPRLIKQRSESADRVVQPEKATKKSARKPFRPRLASQS